MTERLERLLQNRYRPHEPARAEPFHDAWSTHADKPRLVRLAHAIGAQWLGARLIVDADERIVGRLALESIVTWTSAKGMSFIWDAVSPQERARDATSMESPPCSTRPANSPTTGLTASSL